MGRWRANEGGGYLSRYESITLPVGNGSDFPRHLKFKYVNWRGDDHEYVIEVEAVAYGKYDSAGADRGNPENWVIHGMVITRDGSSRPDMGPTRRRTFLLNKIRNPEEVA